MQIPPHILKLISTAPGLIKANKTIVQDQLLHAVVLRESTAAAKKTALIQIDQQIHRALLPAHVKLKNGQRLRLQVLSTDRPMQLKIVDINPPSPTLQLQKSLLREVIPRQQGLDQLLSFVNQKQAQVTTQNGAAAQQIKSAMALLLQAAPKKNVLFNATGVIRAIKNSGLFMEAGLRSQLQKTRSTGGFMRAAPVSVQALMQHDLKAVLLQAAQRLTYTGVGAQTGQGTAKSAAVTAPPIAARPMAAVSIKADVTELDILAMELNKHMRSSVARIETNQARALAAENIPSNWMIDIPVQDNQGLDLIELHIQQEEAHQQEEGAQPIWSITVHLHLGKIGLLHARLHLNGVNLTATLWAEQDIAYRLIQDHIPILHDQLKKTGLDIQRIDCLSGSPPQGQSGHTENLISTTI